MALLLYLLPIIALALFGVGIYEHVTALQLSLPVSPTITALVFLIPILAAINTLLLPSLTQPPHKRLTTTSSSSPPWSLPSIHQLLTNPSIAITLQTIQALLTTILATLLISEALLPGDIFSCRLSTQWQHLFQHKDEQAIRHIQDALECCGFNTVVDRAWPFRGVPGAVVECAARFDRALACREPWTRAVRAVAGGDLGVLVVVGVFQVASLLLARYLATRQQDLSSWVEGFLIWPRRVGEEPATRPLLTDRLGDVEEVDEEETGNGASYGSTETRMGGTNGPRVQPSGLHQEANQWTEE